MKASPKQVAQWINDAHAANAGGNYESAAKLCRQSVEAAPDIPEAWYNLGLAMRGLGRRAPAIEALRKAQALAMASPDAQNSIGLEFVGLDAGDDAKACFERAIMLAPGYAFAHSNLGSLLGKLERWDDAEASLKRAIALQPELSPAYVNLGGILNSRKQYQAAEEACRKAIALDPKSAQAWNNLGSALSGQKRLEPAMSACQKAVELDPALQRAWMNLGGLLTSLGRFGEAEAVSRRSLELGASAPEVWSNLCGALVGLKQYRAAESAGRKSVAMDPGSAVAWCNLAGALLGLNQYAPAEAAGVKSVGLDPGLAMAWCNLATALIEQYRPTEAETACRRAIQADPGLAVPRSVMARIQLEKGAFLEADAEFRQAIQLAPDDLTVLSRRLFWLNYMPGVAASEMLAAAQAYDRAVHRHVVPFDTWKCSFEEQRKLRIGLVSGDFRRHPVGYLLKGPLRQIDKSGFEIHAYSNHATEDEVTAELRDLCEGWTHATSMSDLQLAEQIREHRIDILLDLTGHTEHGRLPMFARRPAPLQASWLGYFATTGLSEIDWKIGDAWVAPPDEMGHFTEKIWRLPDSCFCFSPPVGAPAATPLPASARGYTTYGCFNNLAKMNDEVVALWSRILLEDGSARLMLKSQQLRSAEIRQRVLDRYFLHGIGPERLQLEPAGTYLDYLSAYARVDIALDPFPFTGGATTADALWMGVPVLTLQGDRFVAHQGESLLHSVGLESWIAPDRDAYVRMALSLASDRQALADLRGRLRDQAAVSPLFDAERYARNLENCWRGMWLELCKARARPD